MIDQTLEDEPPDAISFRLPPDLDLDGIAKFMVTLRDAVNPAHLREHVEGVDVRVNGFDVGSEWITITLGGIPAALFLLKLLKGVRLTIGFDVKAKAQLEFHGDDLTPGTKKELEANTEKKMSEQKKARILETAVQKNAEAIQHLTQNFDALRSLVEAGTVVRPALNAPEVVQEEYRKIEQLPAGTDTTQRQLPPAAAETASSPEPNAEHNEIEEDDEASLDNDSRDQDDEK